MARLTWLADVLRAAGLNVSEAAGWKTRGAAGWSLDAIDPAGVIAHATVTRRTSGPAPGLNIIINGREGLAGPIAQLHLARDGRYTVVAAGVANHAGSGGLWGVTGNQRVIGIEAENDNGLETAKYGGPEPWPAVQYDAYVRGTAAILRHLGLPASRVGAHREWSTTGKSDPVGIDMTRFRASVAAAIAGGDDDMTPEQDTRLRQIERILLEGKRLNDPQTSTGADGVSRPIAFLPRAFHQTGIDLNELMAEVDTLEEGDAGILAAVRAIETGDWEALAARLEASQARALMATLQRVHVTIDE